MSLTALIFSSAAIVNVVPPPGSGLHAATKPIRRTTKRATKSPVLAKPPMLAWEPCGGSVTCSSITVPIDAQTPELGTTRIGFGRLRARNAATRRGVLFVNPGGPSGSAIDLVRSIEADRRDPLQALGFDDWDVIGVDPRGVGRSGRFQCGTRPSEIGVNPFEITSTVDRASVRKAWRDSCVAKSGMVFFHAGTVDHARDLDRVRIALGEERIDFLGYSYGTVIGAVYAARFGTHVRTMVLDAPVDPSRYGGQFFVDDATAYDDRFRAFAESCSSVQTCTFRKVGRDSAAAMKTSVGDLLAQAETAQPGSAQRLAFRLRSLVEESSGWRDAAGFLSAVETALRDGTSLGATPNSTLQLLADDPSYWAVNCTDGAFAKTTQQDLDSRAAARSAAPLFGQFPFGDLCLDWPSVVPIGPIVANLSRPALVISATADARTPLLWGTGLVSAMGTASLLIRDGDGHISLTRSTCVRTAVSAFMQSTNVPIPSRCSTP